MSKIDISKVIKTVERFCKKNSRPLYFVTSLFTGGVTIAWTIKATVDATHAVDAEKEKRGVDKLPPKDILAISAPHYIGPAVTGVISTVTGAAGYSEASKVIEAGKAAIEVTNSLFEDHKEAVRDICDEETVKKIEQREKEIAIERPRCSEKPFMARRVEESAHGIATAVPWIEPITGVCFIAPEVRVDAAINKLNSSIMNGDPYVINDILQYLSAPTVPAGESFGWDANDCSLGLVERHRNDARMIDGVPYAVLSTTVPAHYID